MDVRPSLPALKKTLNRRNFLGGVAAAAAATTLARPAAAEGVTNGIVRPPASGNPRIQRAYDVRMACAERMLKTPAAMHATNGDNQRYTDGSAAYTKCVQQDAVGRVNPAAYAALQRALTTQAAADFEAIPVGGTRLLDCPQGGLAYTLEGADCCQFGAGPSLASIVPAPPAINSAAHGVELMELYWAAQMRDLAFTDYGNSEVAAAAAAELSKQPTYAGPRNAQGQVTTDLLFRGNYPGSNVGPYVSQLLITPTKFGAMPMSQQYVTYQPGIEYMLDPVTYLQVQNGIATGLSNQPDSQARYLHDGRGLGAYTHVDAQYQAYITAYLALMTLAAPLNPGNPYIKSKSQVGCGTFGPADVLGTLGDVTTKAFNSVWFQKWFVHLRHRPENAGALVYLANTGQGRSVQASLNDNILNSKALSSSYQKFQSWFLPQAFPEGSPAHPSYPTGHGAIAGACITILKFYFDGAHVLQNPLVPSSDGTALENYGGNDAGDITVNGELNKLAYNISFGHGIHAGIHWRTDTVSSIALGEAFAMSYLQDRAVTYPEKFTVKITRLDGSIATISNE